MGDMPETIVELAALEQRLIADLAAVRVRISERAGQTDPDPDPEPKKATKKAPAK